MAAQPYRSTVRRMTFFERATYTLTHLSANKIAALLIWLASVYTTSLVVAVLHPAESGHLLADLPRVGWLIQWMHADWRNILFALAVQGVLTTGERAIWQKSGSDIVAVITVAVDVLINLAGLYPYFEHFGDTPLWGVVQKLVQPGLVFSPLAALILALIGGIIVAAGPEILWSRDTKRKKADDEE